MIRHQKRLKFYKMLPRVERIPRSTQCQSWKRPSPLYNPSHQRDQLSRNSPESGHRGNLPQHNKGHIWQTHSKHHSQWWKTESISSKIRNKTRMSTLTTIIQHSFGSPSHSNQRRKRNKRNTNWKRRSKTVTLCRWHDTIHRES